MKTITINIPDDCEVKIIKKEEKKEEKKEPVIKTFEDLISNKIKISGYFISNQDATIKVNGSCEASKIMKDVASSYKVAKSMLAMAIISQLMPFYGKEITDKEWEDRKLPKFVIGKNQNLIYSNINYTDYCFLSFHTSDQRDDFLKYNEQLVKDYLMID